MYLAPLGRLLLAGLFLMSGVNKVTNWEGTMTHTKQAGVPMAEVALPVATALEFLGGISVVLGLYARLGGLALLLFLVPVTYYMHAFWNVEPTEQMTQTISFMKNVTIMGGLLLVIAFGAGPVSLDALRSGRSNEPRLDR
jgi:putative oxidoreductase